MTHVRTALPPSGRSAGAGRSTARFACTIALLITALVATTIATSSVAAAATAPTVATAASVRPCTTPTRANTDTARSKHGSGNDAFGPVCETQVGSISANATVTMLCWTLDAWWKGKTTDNWFLVASGTTQGFVLADLVRNQVTVPACSTRSDDRAAIWAIQHNNVSAVLPAERNGNAGATTWSGWCWVFSYDSWKLGAGKAPARTGGTADAAMKAYAAAGRLTTTGTPPRGALIFWAANSRMSSVGHVAVSLGNGWMMTTQGFGGPQPVVFRRIADFSTIVPPTGYVDPSVVA